MSIGKNVQESFLEVCSCAHICVLNYVPIGTNVAFQSNMAQNSFQPFLNDVMYLGRVIALLCTWSISHKWQLYQLWHNFLYQKWHNCYVNLCWLIYLQCSSTCWLSDQMPNKWSTRYMSAIIHHLITKLKHTHVSIVFTLLAARVRDLHRMAESALGWVSSANPQEVQFIERI